MKIVQINSVSGVGSTGRIAVDIANLLDQHGHTCYIAYGHGSTTYHNSYRIGNKFIQLLHNCIFSRLLGLHGYGSFLSTYKFTRWLSAIKPDIIHIHNIHANYINYKIFFNYIIKNNIPVVFTLHDCFNYTGKCSYYSSVSCEKWKSQCCSCPIFKSTAAPSLFFDFSSKIFLEKKKIYEDIKTMAVVAVSKWLRDEALKSILNVNTHRIDYIYNWIDYNIFKPAKPTQISLFFDKYHLNTDIKYLISVSQLWYNGNTRYDDALKLARRLPEGYKLLIIGTIADGLIVDPIIDYIPYLESREDLSVAYSMAEAYVHFSVQDTFGLVIAEAMSCGTIPITYNATACSEIPSTYGIIVQPRDIDAIVNSLPLLEQKKASTQEMIEYVKHKFDKATNINKYLSLYKHLVSDIPQ